MRHDVFMAGYGGQGILMAGNLLAYAAILEGQQASFFPAYGVEKRGGAANCTVVISDADVGSPIVGSPSNLLVFNQLSMDKYFPVAAAGGYCLVNSSLVTLPETLRDDVELVEMPASDMALEAGDARLVNMVMLGAFAKKSGAVGLDSLKEGLKGVLPERNHRFIPMNINAIDAGAGFVTS